LASVFTTHRRLKFARIWHSLAYCRKFLFREGGDEKATFLTKFDLRDILYCITMLKRKTYKYHLSPTRKQAFVLTQTLDDCRVLYNPVLRTEKILMKKAAKA
jgi:hypothetical protein